MKTSNVLLGAFWGLFGLLCYLSLDARASETWDSDDLDSFIDGATMMAAGGGGSPSIAKKLLAQYFTSTDRVVLDNIGDIIVGQDYSAASVGAIGSPDKLFDLPDPLELAYTAYSALDWHYEEYQQPIKYLMPIEVGS